MGRDHTRHEGHNRPLGRTMAQTAPVPAPAASQSPHTGSLRHFGRSSFPHSPLPAQAPSRAGYSHPESPPGTIRAVCLPSIRGSPCGQDPDPARAGRRLLSASAPALRTSLRVQLRHSRLPVLRLPRAGCEPVFAPRNPHLPSQAQGSSGRPPHSGRSSSLSSHSSPCGQNGKEGSLSPRQTPQGLHKLRYRLLAESISKGGGEIRHEWARRPLAGPP